MSEKIGIRPGVGILSVLRYLNYNPWYALAEYIDNAIDSYFKCREALLDTDGIDYKLVVEIEINASARSIRITDNAAGISSSDLGRALRTAEPPPDQSRLSEFGMGMKAASCWFAPLWSIQTKALGDSVARHIRFDVPSIVKSSTEEITVDVVEKPINAHYTVIQLNNIFEALPPKVIARTADHLASLYRFFLQSGEVIIKVNGNPLSYSQPEILVAPLHSDIGGEQIRWQSEIDFECEGGRKVKGFVAIRETGSTSKAGFALFRRGRVILGSTDEGFRPEYIFGRSNSYRFQRLFGELHLEGFGVSHTKDGFQWEGCYEELLQKLHRTLSNSELPMLVQAEKYRKREDKPATKKTTPSPASIVPLKPGHTTDAGALPGSPSSGSPNVAKEPNALPAVQGSLTFPEPQSRTVSLTYKGAKWQAYVELSSSHSLSEWLDVGDHLLPKLIKEIPGTRKVGLRIALAHPFSVKMLARCNSSDILVELAVGLAIAQAVAISSGATNTSLLLDYFSDVLALSNS